MIKSPIFGEYKEPDILTEKIIEATVENYPVAVFQAINQKLNALGFIITIDVLQKENES